MKLRFERHAVFASPEVVVDVGEGWHLATVTPTMFSVADPATPEGSFRPNVMVLVRPASGANPLVRVRKSLDIIPGAKIDQIELVERVPRLQGLRASARFGPDMTIEQHHLIALLQVGAEQVILHVVATGDATGIGEAKRRALAVVRSAGARAPLAADPAPAA